MTHTLRSICLLLGVMTLTSFTGCAKVVSEQARTDAKVLYDMAVASLQEGHLNEALMHLTKADEKNPYMPEIHNALGLTYHAKQQTDKSLAHYKQAIKLRPDFYEARNNYATLLMDLGRYDEAITELKTILDNPLYITPHFAHANMGWALHQQGHNDEAVGYLKQALIDAPQFCRGYLWLATVYDDMGKTGSAIGQMRLFFTRCIENSKVKEAISQNFIIQANRQMAVLLTKDGKTEEAKPYFEACAEGEINAGEDSGFCIDILRSLQ